MNLRTFITPALAGALLLLAGASARAAEPAQAPAAPSFDRAGLAREIVKQAARVPEFVDLREAAASLGLRAWLFGGTAAAYAHYVKQDLLRRTGAADLPAQRFDYDYMSIFRSTQDFDVAIDWAPKNANRSEAELKEAIDQLKSKLQARYGFFQGSREDWEIRLLRHSYGRNFAILDNPDFQDQNTDSNSTGAIELTEPAKGEAAVRDAKDWKSKDPRFLRDVHEGKLHFYVSPRHRDTVRFREGRNPEIFGAIRHLTKAFQFELGIDDGDLKELRRIVREFDPERDLQNPLAARWLEKNAKKLFQHAVNLEYAAKVLDDLGLREKLIGLGDPKEVGSMPGLLNRKPLPDFPLGGGKGMTAAELGLTSVAHETSDFPAYESITRAAGGQANVFVSRPDTLGEHANYGEGFYAAVGRKGAAGTGITVRFAVAPEAREGVDFRFVKTEGKTVTRAQEGGYVVFLNKRALRVIPESIQMTPVEYFRFLSDGNHFNSGDRALIEKLRRKLSRELHANPEKMDELVAFVREKVNSGTAADLMVKEWLDLPESRNHPEILKSWFGAKIRGTAAFTREDSRLVRALLGSFKEWRTPENLDPLLDPKRLFDTRTLLTILEVNGFFPKQGLPEKLARLFEDRDWLANAFKNPEFNDGLHNRFFKYLLYLDRDDPAFARIMLAIARNDARDFRYDLVTEIADTLSTQPEAAKWLHEVISRSSQESWDMRRAILDTLMGSPHWQKDPLSPVLLLELIGQIPPEHLSLIPLALKRHPEGKALLTPQVMETLWRDFPRDKDRFWNEMAGIILERYPDVEKKVKPSLGSRVKPWFDRCLRNFRGLGLRIHWGS